MYTALLVDDERSLRESISEIVEWEANGFQLLGVAENGLDALQFMEETAVPDLLITDIKMPVMDGIELAQRIREEHPTVKVVFLSGHDEFEYAVAGIQLKVASYLLKPVSKVEIEEMLQKIHDQISEEVRKANDMSLVKKNFIERVEVLKVSFLISLLTETYANTSQQGLDDFLLTYGLEFLKKEKRLLVIHLQPREGEDNEELIRFSLSTIVGDIMREYGPAEVFLFSSAIVCLIANDSREEIPLMMMANEIVESSQKLLNQAVVIGVSEPYADIFLTKKAYRQAIEAADYARHSDKGSIIYVTDIETKPKSQKTWEELDESGLLLALKTGDRKTVDEMLAQAFPDSSENRWEDGSSLQVAANVVFVTGLKALRDSGVEMGESFTNWYHVFSEEAQYRRFFDQKEKIRAFSYAVLDEIHKLRSQHTNTLIAKSLAYLEENFHDPDISLKSVSHYLSISPNYFSAVFKKETGKSFIEMLTERKMNKAKELVLTTEDKMFEIAQKCGYSDQHYFSYSFKKFFGVSPTKMRSLQPQ